MKPFLCVLLVIIAHFSFIFLLGTRVGDFTSDTAKTFIMFYAIPLFFLVINSVLFYRTDNRKLRWIWFLFSVIPGCLFIISVKYQPRTPGGFEIFPEYHLEFGYILPAIHFIIQIIFLKIWVSEKRKCKNNK
ncbi:hypothetical protein EJP82_02330 [Paenibacillus anaericanus]|uniref:Uncharacterized protein n=1 Tax=Paenibacillus anaericanus TaxID=170367 RepID=A0A433YDT1_9BACL|nr:hypothetical protein [Paenibacillus anaericanus]RUT48000.1 hypothetical protein EJP82_02330 [Paenibacillus anaericanus]